MDSQTKASPLEWQSVGHTYLSGLCLYVEKRCSFSSESLSCWFSGPFATLAWCLRAVDRLHTWKWQLGISGDLSAKHFICVRLLGVVLWRCRGIVASSCGRWQHCGSVSCVHPSGELGSRGCLAVPVRTAPSEMQEAAEQFQDRFPQVFHSPLLLFIHYCIKKWVDRYWFLFECNFLTP